MGMGTDSGMESGIRRFGVGEAVAPEVHERLEVATVGGFQRGEPVAHVVSRLLDEGAHREAEDEATRPALPSICRWLQRPVPKP